VSVIGDFDAAAVKAALTQLLGDWKSSVPYERVPQPAPPAQGQRVQTAMKDKPNAVAVGSLAMPFTDDHPDYAAMRLAAHVLGASGFDSRLLTRLRQKDGLSYGAGADLRASSFEPYAELSLYAIFAPENRARVEQGFSEELQRLLKDGITPVELDTAKKAMRAASNTWRANDGAVAGAWVGHLERKRSFKWNADLDARGDALTVDQVNAAMRKWIEPAKINWSWAGDFDKGAKDSKPQ
jgi:zinc protease